ncbi:CDP-alcohol phosphatidyltransferase family protein [Parendozoicomonas haliclonae]|uniref:Inner membrane protein YnjF n=1 Tax=Parendozoicomonas haliclonae TaxID=1960125 RepID=A0A1X7AMD9_9GAMM|nr:CDP-alcohol phosphatidyltransferase family protein [Parendozoicomonas haliclonae]SMA49396.1 Inner membrane protein YnjF [Parendozoicomonas haliclonae]
MIDRWTHAWIQAPLKSLAKQLHGRITPDQLTLLGFGIGALSLPLLLLEWYIPALVVILLSRIMDGLDGTLARMGQPTDAGGFLDITLDFLFYSLVILGFALANPAQNALAAAFLIFCFIGTGSSFLAFAIMAEKHQLERVQFDNKSLHYLGGLTEGTETLLFYVAICIWPQAFPTLATIFGILCLITTATRIYGGYQTLSKVSAQAKPESD